MKTPEEIKRGLAACIAGECRSKRHECLYRNERECTMVLSEDALAYIHQLEAQVPRWISVEERLPENEGKYIVCTAKGSVYCAKFSTRYSPGFHTDMNTHITHWMPLPELPLEDDP